MRELGDRRRLNAEADAFAACEKVQIALNAASCLVVASSRSMPGRGVPVIVVGVCSWYSCSNSSSDIRGRPPVVAFMSSVVILYRSVVGCLIAVIRVM